MIEMDYSSAQDVRDATGFNTSEISDAQITAFITAADTFIDVMSGKTTTHWQSSDPEWGTVKRASIAIAASYCFRFIGKALEKEKSFWDEGMSYVHKLLKVAVVKEAAAKEEVPTYRGGVIAP